MDGTVVLEGGSPYLQPRIDEENLEERLRWDPNVWMIKNMYGTQQIESIPQSLSNVTLLMVIDYSYYTKLTTNIITEAFILEFRYKGIQCVQIMSSPQN